MPKIWVHSETMLPTTCPHFNTRSTDEKPDPGCARYHQEYREGVALQEPGNRTEPAERRLATLGRSNFVEVLGCKNGDQQAGPVGDRIAEK